MARIIVADDDPGVRTSLGRYLRKLGHEVVEAAGGGEVVAACAKGGIDLVVTDINMPDMDGIEVLTALRDEDPGVPVIAISGGGLFPKTLLLGNADMLGAFSTVEKPFELDDIRRVVEAALRSSPGGEESQD